MNLYILANIGLQKLIYTLMILERFSKKLFRNLQRSLQVPERYSMQFCQLAKFSRKSSLNYRQLVTCFFVNRWATVSGLETQSVTSATLAQPDMTMVTIGHWRGANDCQGHFQLCQCATYYRLAFTIPRVFPNCKYS